MADKSKPCSKCGLVKSIDSFHKNKSHKDGLQSRCKDCRAKASDEYYKIHKEKILERNNHYVAEHKEERNRYVKQYCADHKEHKKQYYSENREKITKWNKQYIFENKEHFVDYIRLWHKNNPEKSTGYFQKRRSTKRKLISTLTVEQWVEAKEYFSNKCAYCGKIGKLTRDHFIALSKLGEYSHNNIIPVCKQCNCSKHNADFFEWYPQQIFYSKARRQKIMRFLNYKDKVQQLAI
jgi:hypothetical protein